MATQSTQPTQPAQPYVAPHLRDVQYAAALPHTSWSGTAPSERTSVAPRAPKATLSERSVRKAAGGIQKVKRSKVDFVPIAERDKHRRGKTGGAGKAVPRPKVSATVLLEQEGKAGPELLLSMFERGMLLWDHYEDKDLGYCLRVHDGKCMGHYIGTDKTKLRLARCGLVHPSVRHPWWLVPQSAREIPAQYGAVEAGDDSPKATRPLPQWKLPPLTRAARFFGWKMDNGFGALVPELAQGACLMGEPPPPPPLQRPDWSAPLPPQQQNYALQNLDHMPFD